MATAHIKAVDAICRNCGDKTMSASAAYFRKALYVSQPGKFWFGIFGDKGFYYGNVGNNHFRLVALAVALEFQGEGYGFMILCRLIQRCEEQGLREITFRTHKCGKALNWWRKQGAEVVGVKGDDYEMRLIV